MCLNAEFLETVCHPAPGLYRAGLSKRLVQSDKGSFPYSNGIFVSAGCKIQSGPLSTRLERRRMVYRMSQLFRSNDQHVFPFRPFRKVHGTVEGM